MSGCPDISAWEQLSRGGVDGAAAERLRMHLEICRECHTAFDNFRRNERLLESMRIVWNECADAAPLGPAPIGMKIGRYEITGFLGAGGMAAVYRAAQEQPHRTVALKLMKLGFASRDALRRFEHEAELLGRLHHPGIAHVYEAGVAEIMGQRQPFFAMELIEGQKLTDYANSRNLNLRQRLELIVRIGEAVHYAHQKGIIHRDLKPSNILVADEPDSGDHPEREADRAVGQPKVLDFGVARATDADIQATTIQTDIGQLVGTIPYMSPEQTAGDPKELDVRSDVYALGVVCYELLTRQLPYSVKGRSVPEAARVIQHDDPTPLSSINRVFRGDIETIVAKALEKDKERRYAAVSALVADIRRYLNDEPIAARPPSATYQLAKFARRNRALVGGIAAVFVMLLLGLVGTGYGMIRATVERNRAIDAERSAQARRAEAETVIALLTDMLGSADPHKVRGADYTVRQLLDDFGKGLGDQLHDQPEVEATIQAAIGNAYRGLGVRPQTRAHLEAALDLRRKTHGSEHPDVAQSLFDYAWCLHDNAEYPAAEQMFRESLEMRRKLLGNEHKDVAACLNGLSDVLRHEAKFDEAEPLAREALAIRQKLFGSYHRDVAQSFITLGALFRDRGDLENAETYMRQGLAIDRKIYASEHPDIASTLRELGQLLYNKGDYAGAEPVFEEALSMARRTWGENHHEVGMISTYFGVLLRDKGDYGRAETLLRQGVALGRMAHGDVHTCIAWQRNALAVLLRYMGELDAAESMYRDVFDVYRKLDGEDAMMTNVVRVNLADVLIEKENLAEAEALATTALTHHRARHGEKHRNTSDAMRILGLAYIQKGDSAAAEPLLRDSVRILRDVPDNELWRIARAESGLGACLTALNRFADAEPLLMGSYDVLNSQKGPAFVETQMALRRIVGLYEAWGDERKAGEWRSRLLPVREATTSTQAVQDYDRK